MRPYFRDDDFQFGLEITLGATFRQAADVGEVLATAARIDDGDADSWVHEWTATAGRVWAAACEADRLDLRVSALGAYRRAGTYYTAALHRIAYGDQAERQLDLWRRQRACWEQIIDLSPVPGERIEIPYEDSSLPGFFFRAPDTSPGERRPLVILNNGSDGATSQMWVQGGAGASERGYHWMTFDGPGQQSTLFEHGIPFRPDWEAVLSPVLDTVLQRSDVDPARVAVIGISQAGYWVTRALCFENRVAAAVLDPGLVDVSRSWTDPLPRPMRDQLARGERSAFDREMRLAELFSPATSATLRFRGEPYGLNGDSRFALYEKVARYALGDEVAQIITPVLICDPENEQFWPGQSRELHDRLTGPKQLMSFTTAEGADRHCEPLAPGLRDSRIYDWLAGQLDRPHLTAQAVAP